MTEPRTIVAANPSPMTLDGTRTYLIGRRRVAIVDPGPALKEHIHAVADAVGSGVVVAVLLTHAHPDHAEGAQLLAERVRAPTRSGASGTLRDGDVVQTDTGELHSLATPGHTPDHFSFWWPESKSIFCGDLLMGGLDTALVARPEGDLAQYLDSLRKLKSLQPRLIYPAHGERFDAPDDAIDRYIAHREERIAQVVAGLKDGPLSAEALLDKVYGVSLDARLRHYAETAIEAYLAFLQAQQRVRASPSGMWSLT